jgi:hypothetical protein
VATSQIRTVRSPLPEASQLPPVARSLLRGRSDRRRKCLRKADRIAWLEVGHIKAKPDALGGIAALGRIRRLRDLRLCRAQPTPQGIQVRLQREPDWRPDKPPVCFWQAQVLRMVRINQCIGQHRIQDAQPGEQESQRTVVVGIPWRARARPSATAFHDERQMPAIGFDEVIGIQSAAPVIN